MGRAKLFHMPGYAWHLTHRCHDRRFLLKFSRDKRRWLHWLFQAKKRYKLVILGYTVTSNHIHLLVYDNGEKHAVPRSMLLAASRTAREYNIRKMRSGAFWEDHYHATAIEAETHLQRALVYVDLNMVRAGVVDHPGEWPFGGYAEFMNQRQRYRLIDRSVLLQLLGVSNDELLKSAYDSWIRERLSRGSLGREAMWTESIAVGEDKFIKGLKKRLGIRANTREIAQAEGEGSYILREGESPYEGIFRGENEGLSNKDKFRKTLNDL